MVFPLNFWILFGICMLVSAIGFKNYVWFISLGYGFSIAGLGALMLVLFIFVPALNAGTVGIMVPVSVLFTIGMSRILYKKGVL